MNKGLTGRFRFVGFAFVVLFLLSCSEASQAQVATAEQRAACTPDAFRLCAGEIPNIPAITACMRKNRENLSPSCKAVFPK
jgi:hypothetical protein